MNPRAYGHITRPSLFFLPLVRFGEAIALAKERLDQKNVYFTNPAFDK